MHSSELESGLPDEAEQECIVFFLLGGCREVNRTQRMLSGNICDDRFSGLEDAKFQQEYLQGVEKAS